MDLATIVIPPEEARARAEEYSKAFRESRSVEDEAMAQGFRAAARGLPIIQLSKVIAAGGWFPEIDLPRLAVARADATECMVEFDRANTIYADAREARSFGALVGTHTVRVPVARPAFTRGAPRVWRAVTMVPSVPPKHRPKRGRLRSCHVLWEVDQWTLVPPRDPALIRHIRGDLWSVLAVWDLTELERAVLAQRAR